MQDTHSMFGLIAFMMLFPIALLYIFIFSTTESESQTEDIPTVMESSTIEEDVEEPPMEEADDTEEVTVFDLIESAIDTIGMLLLIAFAALVAVGALFGIGILIQTIYESEWGKNIGFAVMMWRWKTPNALREYYWLLEKNHEDLPKNLASFRWVLKDDIRENDQSLPYASMVFLEQPFIEAFSKLQTILNDEAYLKTFKLNYHQPTSIENKTIYYPILNANDDYHKRRAEFQQASKDTKTNELNTLLSQSFTQLHDTDDLDN